MNIPADEDLHRHAVENLEQADALLFGRVTYEMMEAAFRPAWTGEMPDWMEPFFGPARNARGPWVLSLLVRRTERTAESICGSGMTEKQRTAIAALLHENRWTRAQIAARVGVKPSSVSAVKAHITMRHASTSEPPHAVKDLPRIALSRKSGKETFHRNGKPLGIHLLDFWCWCHSDLLSNAARGRLAEYLVAVDLKVADGVRSEWVAYRHENIRWIHGRSQIGIVHSGLGPTSRFNYYVRRPSNAWVES